jgi:hypothetical protein
MRLINRNFLLYYACFVISVSLFGSTTIANANNLKQMSWQNDFCFGLQQLITSEVTSFEKSDSLLAFLEIHAAGIDSKSSIPAIMEIFSEKLLDVERFWWTQENPATRCFVLSLYLCATDEPVTWVPNFEYHIKRFNDAESKARKAEFVFVAKHRSHIAKILAQVLKKRGVTEKNKHEYLLFKEMGDFNIGKNLSCLK